MTNELKPCPFCGQEAKVEYYAHAGEWWVICKECEAGTGLCYTPEEAIEAWNTRYERTCTTKTQIGCDGFDLCVNCELCNYGWHISKYDIPFKFCPNCGAKVVE